MNRHELSTLALAGACVLAIGLAASSMATAVDTTPDEAINVRYEAIPLGEATVDRLKAQLQPGDSNVKRQQAAAGPSGGGAESSGQRGVGPASGGGSTGNDVGAGAGGGAGGGEDRFSWLYDLLALLLDALLALLALLVSLVVLATAIRYRHQLGALLRSLFPTRDRDDSDVSTREPRSWLPPARPTNDVSRAYYELLRRLGLDERPAVTPGECARAATDAGVDPGPVRQLTSLFEQVRYGRASVTERRRRQSRAALQEIRQQLPDGGGR